MHCGQKQVITCKSFLACFIDVTSATI